jgi:hypothetical protein
MRCQHCNEKLAPHDLWCIKCGKRTEALSKELSAVKSLKETWKKYKPVKGHNLPVGIIATLTGIIPLAVLIWILNFALPDMPVWQLTTMNAVIWTFFIPVLLVPFKVICSIDDEKVSTLGFFTSFKSYPNYFFLTFLSVLFYVIIFFLCKGDPILNLVWLVLVLYWIAIVMPVPVLMMSYSINAWKAVKMSYKHGGDVRWNIFLMVLILAIINAIAAVLFVIGLAITVPFTWFAIRDYVYKMIELEVF